MFGERGRVKLRANFSCRPSISVRESIMIWLEAQDAVRVHVCCWARVSFRNRVQIRDSYSFGSRERVRFLCREIGDFALGLRSVLGVVIGTGLMVNFY